VLLILPPSETKRDGGIDGTTLDLSALSYPSLTPHRTAALKALASLSRNQRLATGALSLGPTQRHELARNRALSTSPVLPAIERYTGVLYDGLDAAALSASERAFAARHVVIHSALFGLLGADDPVPAYRLSHNSRLPGLSLGRHWRAVVSAEIAAHDGLVIDARSEAYASLGPAPAGEESVYLRVVTLGESGRRTALSHFNKKAKGEFARAVIASGIEHSSVDSLLQWAASRGIVLERGAAGELDLVV
jgi:cytoplasmic iron level regulating protein YaaA (DUF328/UPF0246 family)